MRALNTPITIASGLATIIAIIGCIFTSVGCEHKLLAISETESWVSSEARPDAQAKTSEVNFEDPTFDFASKETADEIKSLIEQHLQGARIDEERRTPSHQKAY